jgi:hypothetical protein
MPNSFEDIISSLLIDVIKAQNRANKFSARLVPEYRDPTKFWPPEDPNLGFFPVPNSVIRSFDFRLTFALENKDAIGPANIFNGLHRAVDQILAALNTRLDPAVHSRFADNMKKQYLLLLAADKPYLAKTTALANLIFDQLDKEKVISMTAARREELLSSTLQGVLSDPRLLDSGSLKGLAVNIDLDVLKEADERMLASVNFQVDMRSYQLGFQEPASDTPGGHRLILTG